MDVSSSPTIQYQVLVVAAGLTFLAGFLINVFIVAVNICEWKKGRPRSTTDKVITSLGISRMVFQGVCLLLIISDTYFPSVFLYVWFLEMISIYSNICLSTLLSLIFYLKISTLHNVFLLWLKTLVLNRVFLLIISSVVLSISYALCICLVTLNTSHNSTQQTDNNVLFGLWLSTLIFLTTGPYIIYFISSVLLIVYLYYHVSRMNSERNGTSRLDTYYKTIKFTGFSLFCSTSFIILEQTFEYCSDVFGFLGLYFFWQIFPTLHSLYLIYVTVKLRRQVSNMVRLLTRRFCNLKAPEETVSQ